MGHHSIKVTVDIYGHLVPGANKAAVDRLDAVLQATPRNPGATETKKGSSIKPQPFELVGGADGIRTRGLVTASHARSQLRHSPTFLGKLAGII